jgi:hypothetical protein
MAISAAYCAVHSAGSSTGKAVKKANSAVRRGPAAPKFTHVAVKGRTELP